MDNPCINSMKQLGVCVVVPTYNNAKTLLSVIRGLQEYSSDIIVVNDGSTDDTGEILQMLSNEVTVISYPKNKGKGYALERGFDAARSRGFQYAVTIDSDGQHLASELPSFMAALEQHPNSLIIGSRNLRQENMPQKNTFANRFSNFWFALQTGKRLFDTQVGYRVYPLTAMQNMRFHTSRYEAELEMLVRCAWKCIPIIPVAIEVYYPPRDERVSHFRPFKDFLRISVLNAVLCIVALVYGYPSMCIRKFVLAK